MKKFFVMLVMLFASTVTIYAQGTAAPAANAPAANPPAANPPGANSTAASPTASTPTPSAPAPAQPIAFNHQQHIQTAKMSCNDCHEPRGNGGALAMPQPAKCMSCHNTIATDKPDIKRLAEAAKNEDPIPWVRVYRVPSFVTFSHKTHSAATCEQCHGPVAERTAIALEKNTNMGTCIACHQAKGAPTTCDTCHAPRAENGRPPLDTDATMLALLHIQPTAKPAMTEPAWHRTSRATPQLAALASFLYAPNL
ncbi:MAG TPA: cytochrome c3 family protein [Edaphobacter sp.]|nr:cytochrome c3 family protein [Edaphobacter sp.]